MSDVLSAVEVPRWIPFKKIGVLAQFLYLLNRNLTPFGDTDDLPTTGVKE